MEEPGLIQTIREKGGRAEEIDRFVGVDGLEYRVYAVVDERGRPKILVLKMTQTGFIKKAVQVLPGDAERLAEALRKAKEKLREML